MSEVLKFLTDSPLFGRLSNETLHRLAGASEMIRFEKAGMLLARESEKASSVFLVAEGRAEISARSVSGEAVPVVLLEAGEIFDAASFFDESGEFTGTVKTLSEFVFVKIPAERIKKIFGQNEIFRRELEKIARDWLEAKFLKLSSPFLNLSLEETEDLAERLTHRKFRANELIFRTGDAGAVCYLVEKGEIEIISEDGENERRLAKLGAGALFGEMAILTEASSRTATARAVCASELLEMSEKDLVRAFENPETAGRISELVNLRARPAKASGILVFEKNSNETERAILKNPENYRYFRLSEEGFFIWRNLDGKNTIRDLTLLYLKEFKRIAPQKISEIILGLNQAGFIRIRSVRPVFLEKLAPPTAPREKFLLSTQKILTRRFEIEGVDKFLTLVYRRFLRVFFSDFFLILSIPVIFAGMFFFFSGGGFFIRQIRGLEAIETLWLIPVFLFAVFLHEAGHAFAVKKFGFEVPRVGVGWYWLTPIAFIDTSDIWLGTPGQRIFVSAAGAWANFVTGSIAALVSFFNFEAGFALILWVFALSSYLVALAAFNPLLEYDGYHILTDYLRRPNLRRESFDFWLGGFFSNDAGLREKSPEIFYGVFAFFYTIFCLFLVFLAGRELFRIVL